MEKKVETRFGTLCFRPYTPADEPRLVDLWQTVFKQDISPEHWHWKYHAPPWGTRAIVCVDADGEVVVFFGGVCLPAHIDGRDRHVIQLMDIMSHPRYRGTHVFGMTVAHFFDCYCGPGMVEMLYGFPGKYHYDIGIRYLGYEGLENKVACLSADTKALGRENPGAGQGPRTWLNSFLRDKSRKIPLFGRVVQTTQPDVRFDPGTEKSDGTTGKVIQITRPDVRVDQLWQKLQGLFPFAVQRNSDFLRWRFFNHPGHVYEVWAFKMPSASHIDAYAVLKIEKKEGRAVLVDFLAPDAPFLIGRFMACLAQGLHLRGIGTLITWLPGHHFLTRALIDAGFQLLPEPLGIISTIRPFKHSAPTRWISDHLYYTMGDADLF